MFYVYNRYMTNTQPTEPREKHPENYGDYWGEIATLARDITTMAREEEREISEVLHETIDGHEWVIYTHKAQCVLAMSPNDDAMIENFGPEGVVKDGGLNWSGLAYCAMEADVMAHSDFDADPDDDDDDNDDDDDDDGSTDNNDGDTGNNLSSDQRSPLCGGGYVWVL